MTKRLREVNSLYIKVENLGREYQRENARGKNKNKEKLKVIKNKGGEIFRRIAVIEKENASFNTPKSTNKKIKK